MPNSFQLDFVGIGGFKCATTWMWLCLKDHPQIQFAPGKELHFFNRRHYAFADVDNRNYESRGLAWLESMFQDSPGHKIKGELSVSYLTCPTACERLRKHSPHTKIIAILRDPVERVYSEYWHLRREGIIRAGTSFEQAIEHPRFYLLEKSAYAEHLERYFASFEQVMVRLVDDIVQDPAKFVLEVFSFLGVDSAFLPAHTYSAKVNAHAESRHSWLNTALSQSNYWLRRHEAFGLLHHLHKLGFLRSGTRIRGKNTRPAERPAMDAETKTKLHSHFASEINHLEKLLDRDLTCWRNEPADQLRATQHGMR